MNESYEMTFTLKDADMIKLAEIFGYTNINNCPYFEIQDKYGNSAKYYRENPPSAQPEQDMVDDLISFIEREKGKENRTLADWTVQWILESIIDGECKITGSATDHEEKKMYVEFSFYQEEHDG